MVGWWLVGELLRWMIGRCGGVGSSDGNELTCLNPIELDVCPLWFVILCDDGWDSGCGYVSLCDSC